MNKSKKILLTVAIVIGVLIVGAVIVGVLNALVADGEWNLGWSDYRYDDSGYEIGEGSVPANEVTRIEIDWIDGGVEIVPCQDSYISLTEEAENDLPESAELRWRVSEDGKTLTVKYRKSSWFFSVGTGKRNKTLTLRIPERFFAQLTEIDVDVESSKVTVTDITAQSLEFESETGTLKTVGCTFAKVDADSKNGSLEVGVLSCPQALEMESENGDLTLRLPQDSSFALVWETESGKLSTDFALAQSGNRYTAGDGTALLTAKSKRGNLLLAAN